MKKSKILAPLLGLASVGAVVAPTLTSCNLFNGGGGGGGGTSTTTDVAMTGSLGTYQSNNNYDVTSGKTYNYTGVKYDALMSSGLFTVITMSTTSLTNCVVKELKINGSVCSPASGANVFVMPSGISSGSSLEIKIVYSTTASACSTQLLMV